VALLENAIARFGAMGSVPGPIGSRNPSMAPFDVYAAADGWFVVAVGSDAGFQRLCELLELPALPRDERFRSNAQRVENEAELKRCLEESLRTQPRQHWMTLLSSHGIPTGEFHSVAEIVEHPQIQARGMVVQVQSPQGATLRVAGNPLARGSTASLVRRQPPALDADRHAILAELGRSVAPAC
jgi:CoA:oxalate CoA-transferase